MMETAETTDIPAEICGLILDFLRFHGMMKTCDTLETECREKSCDIKVPQVDSDVLTRQTVDNLWDIFLSDESLEYFKQEFDKEIPTEIQARQPIKELLFMIHVQYSIRPLLEDRKENAAAAMENFRKYLETDGMNVCKSAEFLQFYALPFVPDPQEHPSFKALFQKPWLDRLEERFYTEISATLSHSKQPLLQTILRGKTPAGSDKETSSEKYQKLQRDYEQLLGISSGFVNITSLLFSGAQPDMNQFKELCSRLNVFIKHGSKSNSSSGLAILPSAKDLEVKQVSNSQTFNFHKFGQVFHSTPSEHSKAILLYSIYHRLTNLHSEQRKAEISAIVSSDLFGSSFWNLVKFTRSREYKEQLLKVLNLLSSNHSGREYLASIPNLLHICLVWLKEEAQTDSIIRQNSLGVLQKLSIRRSVQSKLITENAISILADLLDDAEMLSENSLEFIMSTLMNLSLRSSSKKEITTHAVKLLRKLSDLLENENFQIKTYVHGCLYNMLNQRQIVDTAEELGLRDMLKHYHESSVEPFRTQLDHILSQFSKIEDDLEDDDEFSEDGEDGDDYDFEEEILPEYTSEDNEDLVISSTDIVGTAALESFGSDSRVFSSQSDFTPFRPASRFRPRTPFDPPPVRPSSSETKAQQKTNTILEPELPPPPSKKALEKFDNLNINEYNQAFSARPRVVRTPVSPGYQRG